MKIKVSCGKVSENTSFCFPDFVKTVLNNLNSAHSHVVGLNCQHSLFTLQMLFECQLFAELWIPSFEFKTTLGVRESAITLTQFQMRKSWKKVFPGCY